MQNARYLKPFIEQWLKKRMVFIGGPRQIGKTHLSKNFITKNDSYLNWDDLKDREKIKKHLFPVDQKILIFDEIHKYPRWRTLVKGLFDKFFDKLKVIVTGSARLDLFRKGGDSLFGRYHYFRLHPITISEALSFKIKDPTNRLLVHGGFPEPFFEQNLSFSKIWRRERKVKVFHQDLRDLTNLKDYQSLELLADSLPNRVGSLLSLNSLAEDLEKSPHTILNWISILESVYFCYTILPFGAEKIKAVKKSRKLYLWDWAEIEDEGIRFENFVASHLLKYCHFIEDTEGDKMELRFLRDNLGKEVDFIVLKNNKPIYAVECKLSYKKFNSYIYHCAKKFNIPKVYQVHLGTESFVKENALIIPFSKFCKLENLV